MLVSGQRAPKLSSQTPCWYSRIAYFKHVWEDPLPHSYTHIGIGSGYPSEVTLLLLLCIILLLLYIYVGKKYTIAFGVGDMTPSVCPVCAGAHLPATCQEKETFGFYCTGALASKSHLGLSLNSASFPLPENVP